MTNTPRLFEKLALVTPVACLLAMSAFGEAKHLYIANDDHTDFVWLADVATYDRVFQEQIDYNLAMTEATRTNASPFQNRFNLDGSYWLWAYEKNRTPAEFARVIAALKDGHLSSPLNALVSCYGAQPAEAVLRGMYYAGQLERKHDLRFTLATAMENRTLPFGLASLWAGSGAKYSWRGICKSASRIELKPRDHEICWSTGPDGQRVLMKWHSWVGYHEMGGYAEAFDPRKAVNYLDSDVTFLRRYRAPGASEPYAVCAAFGFGWDALDRKTGQKYLPDEKGYPVAEHFYKVAEAMTTPERQVFVSNEEDFFRDFELKYGGVLPTENETSGNQWDLYSATMPETSARVRRSVEKLRSAEALATLVSLQQPEFLKARAASRDLAFMNLGLYWEHDWTADGAVTREERATWQEKLAGEIETYVNSLQTDAQAALGGLIKSGGGSQFYAFNPLGWPRTGVADFSYDGATNIHVRDLTAGVDVPHQLEKRDGKSYLRILARDVPPVGYKVFAIQPGSGSAPKDLAAKASGWKNRDFENARVKLTLEDDGAISGLFDLAQPGYNLATNIDGLHLNDLSATRPYRNGAFQVEHSGPVSVTLKCVTDTGRNHTTRITLVRDSGCVEIQNEITEGLGDLLHWTFSFNLPAPDVHTEEVGAIIRVKTKTDGGDYAEKNARYDYATLNHFADITDGSNVRGVTLVNSDCSFVKLGHSTPAKLDTVTAQLNVLAGGQIDGDAFGMRNQNGEKYFLQRFALWPHGAYDQTAAMKVSLEYQNPLVTDVVTGKGGAPYAPTSYSLLKVSNPNALLWALKPAEEGIEHGVIARLWNLSDTNATAEITCSQGLVASQRTTHIETDLEAVPLMSNGAVPATFARQQFQTYRLKLK